MTDTDLEIRSYIAAPLELEVGDEEDMVEGLLVPFNQIAVVPDFKTGGTFQERFDYGAFKNVVKAPNRVLLRMSHDSAYNAQVGYGVHLEERAEGLFGRFKLAESGDALAKTKALLRNCYTGLSVGFAPINNRRDGTVVHRTLVHLEHVAACVLPAYSGARVLAVRSQSLASLVPEGPPVQVSATPLLDEAQSWLAATKGKFGELA